jgi:predicted GNAT superfamily acetyltransferase
MDLKELCQDDVSEIWNINEQGLPGTGKVSHEEIEDLLSLSELAIGAFENGKLLGFVICLLPRTRYGSLNYAWFNQRYDNFIYIDRIAVAANRRSQKIGSRIYQEVVSYAEQHESKSVTMMLRKL